MIGRCIGSYHITRLIGEGGMGAVYEATHESLGRSAAVKVLLPELCQRPELVQRFFNEARAANVVQHPGLISIFDMGHMDDGRAYLIMEYLQGETLSARLRRQRSLGLKEALGLGRQIAAALAAVHQKGIVHRDLKPDNIIVVADAETTLGLRVKILDFGIAKLAPSTKDAIERTRTGMLLGTPRYMAPELCRGAASADDRADVYALGIILYEMLAGTPPFMAEGLGDLLTQHIQAPPAPLGQLNPSVPAEVAALVHSLLEKAPAARPSMAQLVSALGQLGAPSLSGTPVPVGGVTPQWPTPQWHNPSTISRAGGQSYSTSRRTALTASLSVALTLIAVALMLRSLTPQREEPRAPDPPPRLEQAAAHPAAPRPPPVDLGAAPDLRPGLLLRAPDGGLGRVHKKNKREVDHDQDVPFLP